MSDESPPLPPGHATRNGPADRPAEALTPDAIDAVLANFRAWLTAATVAEPTPAGEVIDLSAVVGHFTALRHEVNLLTKTTRAAVEQNAEALKSLQPAARPEDRTPALLKAVIDIADSLAGALKQVERGQAALRELLDDCANDAPPTPSRPGLFWRLLGFKAETWAGWADAVAVRDAAREEALAKLAPLADGLADGYAMSLRRVEAVLPQYGLDAIECEGLPFDPELMEAVEVVEGTPSGTVVEEVRRGYLRGDDVYRFALVKVAR